LQDNRLKPVSAAEIMAKEKNKKDRPIASLNKEEREEAWEECVNCCLLTRATL